MDLMKWAVNWLQRKKIKSMFESPGAKETCNILFFIYLLFLLWTDIHHIEFNSLENTILSAQQCLSCNAW